MSVKIFHIVNKRIEVNTTCLLIPELKKVYEGYEDPLMALSFVGFMTDPTEDNPYLNLYPETREEMLLKDFKGSYKATDKLICDAIEKCNRLNETTLNRVYLQVRGLLRRLGDWADTAIINDGKDGNITHLLKMVKDFGAVAKQFKEAEKLKLEEDRKNKQIKKPTY